MDTRDHINGEFGELPPPSTGQILSTLIHLKDENDRLRELVHRLQPRATAFDLLVHTHLGYTNSQVEQRSFGGSIDHITRHLRAEIVAANEAEEAKRAEEEAKRAEKAKAAKQRQRKARKPKPAPAAETPPAEGADAKGADKGDVYAPAAAAASEASNTPNGDANGDASTRRRRGFFSSTSDEV